MEDVENEMPRLFVSYIDLTPKLENLFIEVTNEHLVESLRNHFLNWEDFFNKWEDFTLGFIIVTKRGVKEIEIKGPSISRKMKIVDFSIFLPDDIELLNPEKPDDIGEYLDLVFSGIALAMTKYNVSRIEIEQIKNECKQKLMN